MMGMKRTERTLTYPGSKCGKDPEGAVHDLLAVKFLADRGETRDGTNGLHPLVGGVGDVLGDVELGVLQPLGVTLEDLTSILEDRSGGWLDEVVRDGFRI